MQAKAKQTCQGGNLAQCGQFATSDVRTCISSPFGLETTPPMPFLPP